MAIDPRVLFTRQIEEVESGARACLERLPRVIKEDGAVRKEILRRLNRVVDIVAEAVEISRTGKVLVEIAPAPKPAGAEAPAPNVDLLERLAALERGLENRAGRRPRPSPEPVDPADLPADTPPEVEVAPEDVVRAAEINVRGYEEIPEPPPVVVEP